MAVGKRCLLLLRERQTGRERGKERVVYNRKSITECGMVITAVHKDTMAVVKILSQRLKYHDDNTSAVCGESDKQEGE